MLDWYTSCMKIYVSHSTAFDYEHELYAPLEESSLNSVHKITLPHKETREPFLTRELFKDQDLIIAEVSFPSTGQGIELGWADSFKLPIICCYKQGNKVSTSLKMITSNFIE